MSCSCPCSFGRPTCAHGISLDAMCCGSAHPSNCVLPAFQVPNADRWVQCDRCQEWRVVPAENWQAVQDDPREEWFW